MMLGWKYFRKSILVKPRFQIEGEPIGIGLDIRKSILVNPRFQIEGQPIGTGLKKKPS